MCCAPMRDILVLVSYDIKVSSQDTCHRHARCWPATRMLARICFESARFSLTTSRCQLWISTCLTTNSCAKTCAQRLTMGGILRRAQSCCHSPSSRHPTLSQHIAFLFQTVQQLLQLRAPRTIHVQRARERRGKPLVAVDSKVAPAP